MDEAVALRDTPANAKVRDVLNPSSVQPKLNSDGQLSLQLAPYTGVALRITG